MNNVDILYKLIETGRKGKNTGYSTGIPKLDEYTGGVRRGIYTLIFGTSGSGKSSLALYSYIYRPLKDHPNDNIKLIYYSLEMSAEILLSKLLCLYIYDTFNKVIPYTKLMSWREIISDEDYNYVLKGRKWLESISDKLIIIDKALNNKNFYHSIMTYLEEWGTFEKVDNGNRTIYIKNDPQQLVQIVIDHLALVTPVDGHSKKEEMDLISSYCVTLREKCQISCVILQQENRNSADMDRRKANLTECSSEDLKDTGSTYNDCEICIGVYYPLKFKIKSHGNYPIIVEDNGQQGGNSFIGLRDRYRALCLIKNRHGVNDKMIPCNFFGELGIFRELPNGKTISDYTPFLSLIQPQTTEVKDEVQKEPKKEIMYSF